MEKRTTVFKKSTCNGAMNVYLRCREFASCQEPVDGGVTVSAQYLRDLKVFAQFIVLYRFGREKDEVMGLKFSREFVLASQQIYPPTEKEEEWTDMQLALKKKVGNDSQLCPFKFYFPDGAPTTVSLFSNDDIDVDKACGIRYYLSIFIARSEEGIKRKKDSVVLKIRKVQYSPEPALMAGPRTLIRKEFWTCCGSIEVEATLDKLIFERNETILVNISVQNYSNKKIKKIRVTLFQNVSIQMLQRCQYKITLDENITKKTCPIQPGASLQTIVSVVPRLPRHRIEDGTALDGTHRFLDSDLASSTYLHSYPTKNEFGIIVNYSVRVKLYAGTFNTSIIAELPVVIMPSRISDEIVPIEV